MTDEDERRVAAAVARLGRPNLAELVHHLATRFAEGPPSRLHLRHLDDAGRAAVADLLGRDRLPAQVDVGALLVELDLVDVDELRQVVEGLHGSIPDRRGERRLARDERSSLWDWFDAEVRSVAPDGNLDRWAQRVRAGPVRGGVDRHRRTLRGALAVLARLPADGTTLAALATDALGDPHGLDRGRSIAALVLDALDNEAQPPVRDAEETRGRWEAVGVAPDALSSTVLVLGLEPGPLHPLGRFLDASAGAGEPVSLTLAQLRRWPIPPLDRGRSAVVVENPSVLAEAVRTGWSGGRPLVCSSGRPSVAVLVLVRQLAAAGATVWQHADFDPAGLAISVWLSERAGTRPWRMDAADYVAATDEVDPDTGLRIDGPVPATPWDPGLADAMLCARIPIYEEQLRGTLLDEAADPDH